MKGHHYLSEEAVHRNEEVFQTSQGCIVGKRKRGEGGVGRAGGGEEEEERRNRGRGRRRKGGKRR